MKNKVLILGTHDFGGVTVYVSDFVKSLNDYDFVIPVSKDININSVERFFPNALLIISKLDYSFLSLRKNFKMLKLILVNNNINIIHAHTLRAGAFAALAKFIYKNSFKLVYTGHGLRYTQKIGCLSKIIFRTIEKYTNSLSDKVIFIRKFDYDLALDLNLVSKEKAVYIRTQLAIKKKTDKVFDIRSNYDIKTKYIFANAASIYNLKNPDLFIDIAKIVLKETKEITFLWFGDGVPRNNLIKRLEFEKLSEFVKFVGAVELDLMPKVFNQIDGFLLTSKIETFPLVILEAYAYNVFVVSTNFVGYSEIIENKVTGVVFDMNDPFEAARNILKITFSQSQKINLLNNASEFVNSNFGNNKMFSEQHNDLYKNILK